MKLDKEYLSMMRIGKKLDTQLIRQQQDSGALVMFAIVIAIAIIILCQSCNEAQAYTDDEAVRCLIGEAAGEGVEGMVAVGEAIRNRGMLKGVYGCKASFVNREPEWVWAKAKMAWERSATSNIVGQADHWYADWIPEPYWAKSMMFIKQIGQHRFYRSK